MPDNIEEEEEAMSSCEDCGTDLYEEDIHRMGYDVLCENCYDYRNVQEQEDDDSSSGYINDHDYRPMVEFHNDNGRKSTHQSMDGSVPKLYFGAEIEMESKGRMCPSAGAELITNMCNGLVYCKSDGSLSYGVEAVTHPMSYGYVQNHADNLWSSLDELRKGGFRAWTTSTCGLHIHVSRNAFLNLRHQQKFMWFIYGGDMNSASGIKQVSGSEHIKTIKKFAGRDSTWSKFDRDSFLSTSYDGRDKSGYDIYVKPSLMDIAKGVTKKGNPINSYAEERYLAINRNNRHTLELRFFRPSLRPETIRASIEFVQCLFDYTEQVTANQVLKQNALASFQKLGEYAITNRDKYPAFIARASKRGVFVDPYTPSADSLDGEE